MFEKNSYGKNARVQKISYSMSTLKIIGCFFLILGTFGVAVLENGALDIDRYSTFTLLEAMNENGNVLFLSTMVVICYLFSTMALPIFSKVLIEGYEHTSNFKKYAIRIAVCAVVTEIPYDLAMKDKWFDFSSQNPVFGLLVTLFLVYFLDHFGDRRGFKGVLIKLILILAALFWVMLLRANLGAFTVLITAVLFISAGNGALTTFLGVMVSMLQFPAPLGFICNHFYNGEHGKISGKVFYVIIPLQYLLLGLIGKYLL